MLATTPMFLKIYLVDTYQQVKRHDVPMMIETASPLWVMENNEQSKMGLIGSKWLKTCQKGSKRLGMIEKSQN